jgi:hypothetical protein
MSAEFQVWWIPQIGHGLTPFVWPVPSLEVGMMLCDALAQYDLYQFRNRIKPDYCNAGNVQWRHPILTEGEWHDIDIKNEAEIALIRDEIAQVSQREVSP